MFRFVPGDPQACFHAQIKRWTRQAIIEGLDGYDELLRKLPGVDPVLLAPVLDALVEDTALGPTCRELIAQSRSAPGVAEVTELPIPHPLEYYWANDPPSLELLIRRVERLTAANACVVYLGAPNIYELARRSLLDRRHILLDRSDLRTSALRTSASDDTAIMCLDLLIDPLPDLRADAVVMDPPWYPEHVKSFLWAAAALAEPGASVLTSYPPVGTRPGIGAEREDFLRWAATAGMEFRGQDSGLLRYLSPGFERSAYAAAGLPGVPRVWRGGDLLQFTAGELTIARPPVDDPEEWTPYSIREIPIWVRTPSGKTPSSQTTGSSDSDPVGPLVTSIVAGDVLPSVSRREPLRAAVSVWSSRNRVLGSSALNGVHAICEALESGDDPVFMVRARMGRALSSAEIENVRAAAERLLALVELERQEYGLAG
jgi:hypothetical protein